MEQALVTYSLIRALYDEGRDYIDSFWPFAIQVLPLDKSLMSPQMVADRVAEEFSLSIPVHTVRTLLQRAKQRGRYVLRRNGAYALTNDGLSYVQKMETRRSVERRLSAFIEAASEYLAKKHAAFVDRTYTQKLIEQVVERSNEIFDFAVERPEEVKRSSFMGDEAAVLSFFSHVESADPEQFNTLRDLILGSTLAGLLRRRHISDATRRFKPATLYLDTNFILSVFGLRFPIQCRPALELIQLLNENPRFTLHVLDFTLEEIFVLLRGFAREEKKYPAGIKIDSLYASMKYNKWTTSRVTEFISRIEEELEAFGINVLTTGIRLEDTPLPDPNVVNRYTEYKPEQSRRGRAHDLQAIDMVGKLRKFKARRVEDAGVFFLTEDARLSNYAFIELGHKKHETISEVMPDRLLTNLLWLKDPQVLERIPVETVIAMHSRDLFIHKAVWLRFVGVLEDLQRADTLTDDAASVLIYDAQVHKDLAGLGTGNVSAVDEDWVLGRIESAREQAERKQERELMRQAENLQERYGSDVAELSHELSEIQENVQALEMRDRQRDIQMAEARTKINVNIKRRAHRQAVWIVRFLKGVVLVLIGLLAFQYGPLIVSQWNVAEPVVSLAIPLLVIVLGVLGVKYDPLVIRLHLEDWLMARALRDFHILGEIDPHLEVGPYVDDTVDDGVG